MLGTGPGTAYHKAFFDIAPASSGPALPNACFCKFWIQPCYSLHKAMINPIQVVHWFLGFQFWCLDYLVVSKCIHLSIVQKHHSMVATSSYLNSWVWKRHQHRATPETTHSVRWQSQIHFTNTTSENAFLSLNQCMLHLIISFASVC